MQLPSVVIATHLQLLYKPLALLEANEVLQGNAPISASAVQHTALCSRPSTTLACPAPCRWVGMAPLSTGAQLQVHCLACRTAWPAMCLHLDWCWGKGRGTGIVLPVNCDTSQCALTGPQGGQPWQQHCSWPTSSRAACCARASCACLSVCSQLQLLPNKQSPRLLQLQPWHC